MKRAVLTLLIVAGLAGCAGNTRKHEAYQRWYCARARMLHGVAVEHLKVGQLEKARNKAQEALALSAEYRPAGILLSKVYIEQGHYKLAVEELSRLKAADPKDSEALYLLGVAHEKSGDLPEALAAYRLSQALSPKDMSRVTAAGEVLVAMGQLEEAEVYVAGYLSRADNEPAMFELAARVAMMRRRYDDAAKYFRRACDTDHANHRYHESLGRAQFLAGRHADAIETLKSLTTREGYTAGAWVFTLTGDCQMALGRPGLARRAYCAARDIDTGGAQRWADVAKADLALGEEPRAILAAREALRLEPAHLEASLVLGYALLRTDQGQAAVGLLSKSAAVHPRNATLHCLLGEAYSAAGDSASAKRCYQVAMTLERGNELAEALLANAADKTTHK